MNARELQLRRGRWLGMGLLAGAIALAACASQSLAPASSISSACTDYSAGLAAAAVLRTGLPPTVVTLVNEGNAFAGLVCGLGEAAGPFQGALRAWTLAGGSA